MVQLHWQGPPPPQGWGHGPVSGCPQRGTSHTLQATSCGSGHGTDYLACRLETELVIDIKRELALLRQMLPDARITGSALLPRWVWLGARKVTAIDKIREVVNHKVASRFLEGQAHSQAAQQCRACARTAGHRGTSPSPRWPLVQAQGTLPFVAASRNLLPDRAQPCGVCRASDGIRFSMAIAIDDLFPGRWEAFMGSDCVDTSVSRSSWNQLKQMKSRETKWN